LGGRGIGEAWGLGVRGWGRKAAALEDGSPAKGQGVIMVLTSSGMTL